MEMETLITIDKEILNGTPVFAGTRVPIQTLLDYLNEGESIDDFLDGFPSVARRQVIQFLESAMQRYIQEIEIR